MYDFMEAVITRQTSPEEAYRKLDEMASKQTESLRKLTKQVSSHCTRDHDRWRGRGLLLILVNADGDVQIFADDGL